jgi:DNA-binding NtrC family response regulator
MALEATMGRARKHTVLVVEDDQLQRELVSLIFEESDWNVIQCMSAETAAATRRARSRQCALYAEAMVAARTAAAGRNVAPAAKVALITS